jgi:hypothetical protein
MQSITTIGLDIAKSVFQVHGVDAGGRVVVRRQLKAGEGYLSADADPSSGADFVRATFSHKGRRKKRSRVPSSNPTRSHHRSHARG